MFLEIYFEYLEPADQRKSRAAALLKLSHANATLISFYAWDATFAVARAVLPRLGPGRISLIDLLALVIYSTHVGARQKYASFRFTKRNSCIFSALAA